MNLNKYIFREYDIRGKVSDDFPPDVVESLGRGFGTGAKIILKQKSFTNILNYTASPNNFSIILI